MADFYDAICPLVPIKNALIWHKDRGGPGDTQMEYARDYEVLYGAQGRRPITGRRGGAVIRGFPPVGPQRLHPTEKSADLLAYFIGKHCPPGGMVLDPFVVWPQLTAREATTGHRVLGDDAPRGLLVGCLEDPNAGVDWAESRTGQDQYTVGQQAPEPLGVRYERRPLLVGHGRREVVPRRMQEVDPLGHTLRIVARTIQGQRR